MSDLGLNPALPLRIDNSALRELPLDAEAALRRRQVRGAVLSRVDPTPVARPVLLGWSAEVAALLGLPAEPDPQLAAAVFSGNQQLPGMTPWASRYGGHQFGHWAGQLGDGRAISLCEALGPDGQRWELQLKGAGPTPYARMGDGRAVLRSSIREFLCSEAMFHLGVPTTRALSLVETGDQVVRDMFYDGRPQYEPGAVVCRVAPSFFRIGHLQLPAALGEHEVLRQTLQHVLARHYPHLLDAGQVTPDSCVGFLCELAERTARLVVDWQRVGFVHGVLNTDNVSLLGLTIDYGPYGWMEGFDPSWTPNTTDAGGRRYRFGAQPDVLLWNLQQLARALQPLGADTGALEAALQHYVTVFEASLAQMLAAKLGLPSLQAEEDQLLSEALWPVLAGHETDYLLWFRLLARVPAATITPEALLAVVAPAFYAHEAVTDGHKAAVVGWLQRYQDRVRAHQLDDTARAAAMNRTNPLVAPRNWLVQEAIDKAQDGDQTAVMQLLDAFRQPYTEPADPHLYQKRPEWARSRPGCSMLSCSS